MKRILFSLLFAFSLQSLALETQTARATNSTPTFEEPHWSFLIGSSFIKLAPTVKGNGLTIGAKYNFIPLIGVGVAYTNFKTENEAYNLDGELVLANTYADITPIHYQYNSTKITGGLQVGFASTTFTSNKNESGFYYGAMAAMNIENQIGFSYDMKVSKNFNRPLS